MSNEVKDNSLIEVEKHLDFLKKSYELTAKEAKDYSNSYVDRELDAYYKDLMQEIEHRSKDKGYTTLTVENVQKFNQKNIKQKLEQLGYKVTYNLEEGTFIDDITGDSRTYTIKETYTVSWE